MQRSQTKNTIKIVNCIWISSIKHFLPFLCNKDKVIKNKPKNTPVVRSDSQNGKKCKSLLNYLSNAFGSVSLQQS